MRKAQVSPKPLARAAGAFYLLMIVLGMIAEKFLGDRIIVNGDAAATAANILTHRGMYQLAFALYMVEMSCYVVMTVLLYRLLKPAGETLSLLAASFSLVGCVVKTISRLFFVMPVFVLSGAPSASGFSLGQTQSLVMTLIDINARGAAVAMIFFGLYALVKGYLILRSAFLPRILGLLGMIAGCGWLSFLYMPFAYHVLPWTLGLGLLGSVSQIFWLLAFGVDEERWKALNGRQAVP